jgi:hypothetical protein
LDRLSIFRFFIKTSEVDLKCVTLFSENSPFGNILIQFHGAVGVSFEMLLVLAVPVAFAQSQFGGPFRLRSMEMYFGAIAGRSQQISEVVAVLPGWQQICPSRCPAEAAADLLPLRAIRRYLGVGGHLLFASRWQGYGSLRLLEFHAQLLAWRLP